VLTIRWLASAASTQDEAHQLAASGAPHGTAVAVPVQTSGRGTRGRVWISAEGGLWLSVVCRPAGGAAIEVLGLRVGLALARFLDGLVLPPARVSLKWPNDLLLGTGKLGGILAEARWQGDQLAWVVVGVGLNVRNEVPAHTNPPAARLLDAGVMLPPVELAEPAAHLVARARRRAPPRSAPTRSPSSSCGTGCAAGGSSSPRWEPRKGSPRAGYCASAASTAAWPRSSAASGWTRNA